jgi:hypothetical protein
MRNPRLWFDKTWRPGEIEEISGTVGGRPLPRVGRQT